MFVAFPSGDYACVRARPPHAGLARRRLLYKRAR